MFFKSDALSILSFVILVVSRFSPSILTFFGKFCPVFQRVFYGFYPVNEGGPQETENEHSKRIFLYEAQFNGYLPRLFWQGFNNLNSLVRVVLSILPRVRHGTLSLYRLNVFSFPVGGRLRYLTRDYRSFHFFFGMFCSYPCFKIPSVPVIVATRVLRRHASLVHSPVYTIRVCSVYAIIRRLPNFLGHPFGVMG